MKNSRIAKPSDKKGLFEVGIGRYWLKILVWSLELVLGALFERSEFATLVSKTKLRILPIPDTAHGE